MANSLCLCASVRASRRISSFQKQKLFHTYIKSLLQNNIILKNYHNFDYGNAINFIERGKTTFIPSGYPSPNCIVANDIRGLNYTPK